MNTIYFHNERQTMLSQLFTDKTYAKIGFTKKSESKILEIQVSFSKFI